MPNIKSAKKRVRQTLKRTLRNRVRRERLRKALKTFRKTLEAGDTVQTADALKKVSKAVDKAGKKGILHKNAVNRKKSRLAKAAARAAAQ